MKIDPATISIIYDGILSLPSQSNLTRQPSLYLYWKQALCDAYNKLDLLHYLLDDAAFRAFKRLAIDADVSARQPRAIQLFPLGYTTLQRAQNELNASIHEVLDALCIHTIGKMDAHQISQLQQTHDLARIPSNVLLTFFDSLFLQHGYNRLNDELDSIRVAKGITSITALLAQYDLLNRWATQGNIIWADAYIIGILSQSLNAMGDNSIVIKYHETHTIIALATFIPFVIRQDALKGYQPAIMPIQQGLHQLHAVQLSEQQLFNQQMITQLQQLTTVIQTLQPSSQPSSQRSSTNVPNKFCSTHGLCFHSSNKCKHKVGQHDDKDTEANWTNKQQYLDRKAIKT